MKLKQVKLSGFKSFCDETEFAFKDQGITVIVGPNGCGKSNVVDAIRWALGEQSPRLMRGTAMGDVIFAGSASRKPVGRAEVTLVFDNTDGSALEKYSAFSEISITRKLYRSGDSEYLINKMPCRLMDVRELLMDTGAAGRSYSIVEQGRVEEFVTASPADRRAFMEEAAGIVRYKIKRIAAEKKLEQTRQNLLRVEDILGELNRQEATLREQMESARAYLALQEEVALLKGDLARLRHTASARRCQELDQTLADLRLDEAGIQQRLMTLSAQHEEGTLEQARQEALLKESREKVAHQERELQQGETQLALERQNQTNAQAWSKQLTYAQEELRHRRLALAEQIHAQQAEAQNLDSRTETLRLEILQEEAVHAEHAAQGEVLTSQTAAVQERLLECHTQLNGIEAQQKLLVDRIQEDERRGSAQRAQLLALADELEGVRSLLTEKRARSGQLQRSQETAGNVIRDLNERIADQQAALARQQEQESTLGREVLGCRSRLETLAEIEAAHQGFGDTVRSFLAWADAHPEEREALGLLGPLADLISVPVETLEWTGDYLAPYLEVLVIREAAALPRLAQRLDSLGLGGLRVLALDPLEDGNTHAETDGAERLSHLLSFTGPASGLTDRLFGATRLLPAGTPLHPLPRVGGGVEWLFRDGTTHVDSKGQVTLGKSAAATTGILRRRAEIGELEQRLEHHEHALNEAQAERERLEELLQELRNQLRGREEERADLSLAVREVEQELSQGVRETERLEQVRHNMAGEAERITADLEGYARQRVELETEAQRWRETRTQMESQLAEARTQEGNLRAELTGLAEALTERKVEQSRMLSRLDALRSRLVDLKREQEDAASKLEEAEENVARQQIKLTEAVTAIERLTAELMTRQDALTALRNEEQERHQAFKAQEERQRALEEKLKAERRQNEVNQTRRHEIELALTAEKMRLEQFAAQLAGLPTRAEDAQVSDEKTLENHLNVSQARLRRMEGVNLAAPQEYEALSTRLSFLQSQQADLMGAIEDLESSIRRMNLESRRRFRETFDQVNGKFQMLFPQVFGGGEARLVMTDSEDPLLAGVDIIAQPPGKKLQGLNLLSGGEKALTAISLIFSFFLHKPSPFCLLDEIDAPLDDVNVTRFNGLIDSMTDHSQFIIITHNKRTMEVGDFLYGVTMEEAGVSKLVSVELSRAS